MQLQQQKLLLTDAFRAIPVKNRTPRHKGVTVPIREPNNPQKEQDVIILHHQLHLLPAGPPEKPFAIPNRSKRVLHSRHDKKAFES